MLQYKRAKEFKENSIVNAIINGTTKTKDLPQIKVRENIKQQQEWNIDDYFFNE